MQSDLLLHPMLVHILWTALLYALLTVARAPAVWGIGKRNNGSNPWTGLEPRISQNLKNQFEWPMLFYVICVLVIAAETTASSALVGLAWVFVVGRVMHSAVQIFSNNVRARGIVFTINFVAVIAMWLIYYWNSVRTIVQ